MQHFFSFPSICSVSYPSNFTGTQTSDVVFSSIVDSIPELGSWQNLTNLGGSLTLTARAFGDNFYAQLNVGRAPMGGGVGSSYPGGCCADTLRFFGINGGGQYTDVMIDEIVSSTFEGVAGTDSSTNAPFAYGECCRLQFKRIY